ncbi:GNAT family acetyltransferase [Thozetella sp. PMI_491]|nr:GNAT family acetyltransferase [Thozetella sp. PMI_491]
MIQEGNPYRSARLLYRATQDDDLPIVDRIQNDAWAFANSSYVMMKPQAPHELQERQKALATKALIGVVICLPPPEAEDKGDGSAAAEPAKPIPIGAIGLGAPMPGHQHHRDTYIFIDIVDCYRGKGYGSEAINWILQWGFQIAGLHRIGIECFSYNSVACHLYEKLGFVLEGRKRSCVWFNGGWHDHLIFGMLEDEWRAKTGNKKF